MWDSTQSWLPLCVGHVLPRHYFLTRPYLELSLEDLLPVYQTLTRNFTLENAGDFHRHPVALTYQDPVSPQGRNWDLLLKQKLLLPVVVAVRCDVQQSNHDYVLMDPSTVTVKYSSKVFKMVGMTTFLPKSSRDTWPIPFSVYCATRGPLSTSLAKVITLPLPMMATIYEVWPRYEGSFMAFSASDEARLVSESEFRTLPDMSGQEVHGQVALGAPTLPQYLHLVEQQTELCRWAVIPSLRTCT